SPLTLREVDVVAASATIVCLGSSVASRIGRFARQTDRSKRLSCASQTTSSSHVLGARQLAAQAGSTPATQPLRGRANSQVPSAKTDRRIGRFARQTDRSKRPNMQEQSL